ncbi:tetratricopeptide repeat protein [Silvanigrella aquatica]|uniref:Uncharacterized protein n=1 Tax=Silvanigrella aquatica TaxID=1915309 RepID=A0A1L4CXI8_9BACT|nr:tetratricopeptide repeat protein [Silvanigrella aquatica]APJ02656.1 hypothetical protein AXG55_01395 [Silvanigrella aquatica]
MKLCYFPIIILLLVIINSCVSHEEIDPYAIEVDSQLLSLPYDETFFYYPKTTIRYQRKAMNDKYIPLDVVNYLYPMPEMDKLLNEKVKESKILQTIPNELDVVADSIHDLQRGDTQKSIEKNKNILKYFEKTRSRTLNEDFSISPFREASLALSLAYLQEGDDKEALPILEKLVLYSNKWSPIYIVLSDYYFYKKAYSLSLDVAERGIDLSSENSSYLYVLKAKAYRALGNKLLAKQTLVRAHELFPNNSDINLWTGILKFDENNIFEACKFFNTAYDIDKKNPYAAHNYSYCLMQQKKYEQASQILSVALSNYPSHAHLYYLIGVLENLRNNYYAAQKSWQTYLSLVDESDPNYKKVLFKISQMDSQERALPDEQNLPYPQLPN